MAVHAHNPCAWEEGTGGWELGASLCCVTPISNRTKTENTDSGNTAEKTSLVHGRAEAEASGYCRGVSQASVSLEDRKDPLHLLGAPFRRKDLKYTSTTALTSEGDKGNSGRATPQAYAESQAWTLPMTA